MKKPQFQIDFNRMYPSGKAPADDLFDLSFHDKLTDKDGQVIELYDGMEIYVFDDDRDDYGRPCVMIAAAIAIKNPNPSELKRGNSTSLNWICRLTSGVQFISLEQQKTLL